MLYLYFSELRIILSEFFCLSVRLSVCTISQFRFLSFSRRYNRNQIRVDQASILGTLGGAGGSLLLGGSAVNGAVVGLVGGTVAMGLYNTIFAERHL